MSTTDRSIVILKESNDWLKWLELIKSAAGQKEVWQFITPKTSADLLPVLEFPQKPTPGDVKAPSCQLTPPET
jgi:hypothetical protein